ncbi:MAG: diphthine synthase [Thermoplasmatales archaeon]|nr:diphthine synthase [Thermoplasmatales archaeon]
MAKGLVFVGLGLSGIGGMTVDGLEALRACDRIYAEFYTSKLIDTDLSELAEAIGKELTPVTREQVEEGRFIVLEAKKSRVGFVAAGDTMAATTHLDLRIQAAEEGVPIEIHHGISVFSAVPSALGLQPYKFGRTVTLPFLEDGYHPRSPYDNILENKLRGLHSMVLLDIREDESRYMTAKQALEWLFEGEVKWQGGLINDDTLVCVASNVGSRSERLTAGYAGEMLKRRDLGDPLSTLVLPGTLHFMEAYSLVTFAGAPEELID